MIRLRYADEWVGLLVVAALVLFAAAILHAGVLRDWFRPVSHLRIVLPATGVAGLAVGADVEILGTHAGVVRQIVISPTQEMYAEADIDDQARAFLRRDSRATIRRRYGVAGAAYLDVSRGTGPPLDWSYAVIDAVTERDPTESIGSLIDQLRQKVFPILDNVDRSTKALADVSGRIAKGQGDVGRLLIDETMVRQVEAVVAKAGDAMSTLSQIEEQLRMAAGNVKSLSERVAAPDRGVPGLLRRADATLATLHQTMQDLALAARRAPKISHNVESGTQDLPGLLTQTQETAHELELLAIQLRGVWLLGGGGKPQPQPARLPATEIRP
jgi:phospholipid/cholesterol/gamma-HCH transport system substrate-binding protein